MGFPRYALSSENLSAARSLVDKTHRFLLGPAGSGKTTIINSVADMLDGRVYVYAPTHVAANVLRSKGVKNVYLFKTFFTDKLHRKQIVSKGIDTLIFDEVSMMDFMDYKDILSLTQGSLHNKPHAVFCGDWRQLPAITSDYTAKGEDWLKYMSTRPDAINLTGSNRASSSIKRSVVEFSDYTSFDAIIVASNVERHRINFLCHERKHGAKAYMRTRSANETKTVQLHPGDKLIAKFNTRDKRFQNNEIYIVKSVRYDRMNCYVLFNGMRAEVKIPKSIFAVDYIMSDARKAEAKKLSRTYKEGDKGKSNHFELCYAITCHAAQGTEYDRVCLILDETLAYFEPFARNFFYVGTTRARHEIVVVDADNQMQKRGLSFDTDAMFSTNVIPQEDADTLIEVESAPISTEEQVRDEPAEVLAEVESEEDDLSAYEAAFADAWGSKPQAPVVMPKHTHVPQSPAQTKPYVNLDFEDDDLDCYLPAKSQLPGIYDSSAHQYGRQAGFR